MPETKAYAGLKNLKFALFSLICGLSGQYMMYAQKNIFLGIPLLAVAAIIFIYADKNLKKNIKEEPLSLKKEAFIMAVIFITGIFFRSYRFAQMPPGCFVDEGFIGLDMLDVLNGSMPVYIGVPTDNPAVFLYFGAAVFKLFGAGMVQMRSVSAALGIMTIPAFYFMLRYLYGQKPALLGAFLFAVMRWHVWFSRMGLHTIFAVLIFVLIIYFAARAYREKKWLDFMLAGIMAGFSQYTYTAARLLPIWLGLVIIYIFFTNRGFITGNWKKIIAAALLAAFISIPIIMFAAGNPGVFLRRQKETSIFTKTTFDAHFNGKTIPQVIAENAENAALMFNYKGDAEGRYNIPGEPMLDFFTGLCAFFGLAYMLYNFRSAASFTLVAAFFIIMSPNLVTESSPNACRSLMAAPLVIIFAAVYISKIISILNLSLKSRRLKYAFFALGTVVLICTGFMNYDAYFHKAAASPGVWNGFSVDAYDAAVYYNSKGKDWEALASIQQWKKMTFDFMTTLGGRYPYSPFRIEESVPVSSKSGKNFVYILSSHYYALIDPVFRVLYPGGRLVPFYNISNKNKLPYFAYEIPYSEIKNLEKRGYFNGLTMRLYETKDWSGPVKSEKIVPVVFLDQDFGTYSWIWTGRIKAEKTGTYVFEIHSAGFSGLYIDGQKVLENEGYNKGMQESLGWKYMKAGLHKLEVRYCQGQELAKIEMRWIKPGGTREAVPCSALFPK